MKQKALIAAILLAFLLFGYLALGDSPGWGGQAPSNPDSSDTIYVPDKGELSPLVRLDLTTNPNWQGVKVFPDCLPLSAYPFGLSSEDEAPLARSSQKRMGVILEVPKFGFLTTGDGLIWDKSIVPLNEGNLAENIVVKSLYTFQMNATWDDGYPVARFNSVDVQSRRS